MGESKTKRYLVFVMDSYYPEGGWNDYLNSFDTLEEAVNNGKTAHGDYWHVVDLEKGFQVESGRCI